MKRAISIFLMLAVMFVFCGFASAQEAGIAIPGAAGLAGSVVDSITAENHEITITAEVTGLQGIEELLNQGMITILQSTDEELAAMELTVSLPGCSDLTAILGVKGETICVAFPMFSDTVYEISPEYLMELLSPYLSQAQYLNLPADGQAMVSMPPVPDFSVYADILMQLSNPENTTMDEENFVLPALEQEVTCSVLRFSPSLADWNGLISGLTATARQDEVLAEYLKYFFAAQYKQNNYDYSSYYESEEAYVDDMMAYLNAMLAYYAENPDELAAALDGAALTVAMTENGPAAIMLEVNDSAIGYESCGDLASGREDVIAIYASNYAYAEILALNTLEMTDSGILGCFTMESSGIELTYTLSPVENGLDFDINAMLQGMELGLAKISKADGMTLIGAYDNGLGLSAVVCIDTAQTAAVVVLPEGAIVAVTDENSLQTALQEVVTGFSTWASENGLA